jgi:formylglycine-generating enzyme required for sulfatase activity
LVPVAHATKIGKDGLTYVWVPRGTFQMGCSLGDQVCDPNELPPDQKEPHPHQVTITTGFWMGKTEVTQEAYEKRMSSNPSKFKGNKLPVENINWMFAESYCEAANMRLPTEAEWEYAARAGTHGSRYGELDEIAWYYGNSEKRTHEVGGEQKVDGKRGNDWGLYDMLGNVWEWVWDWYDVYPSGPATDPQGPLSGTMKLVRGGAFELGPVPARASYRFANAPTNAWPFGFRCVEGRKLN